MDKNNKCLDKLVKIAGSVLGRRLEPLELWWRGASGTKTLAPLNALQKGAIQEILCPHGNRTA